MSSTVVRAFQPPACWMQARRHTPEGVSAGGQQGAGQAAQHGAAQRHRPRQEGQAWPVPGPDCKRPSQHTRCRRQVPQRPPSPASWESRPTGGAVEVEEGAGGRVRVLLTAHVVVERHLLRLGQVALLRVGEHPARLHVADLHGSTGVGGAAACVFGWMSAAVCGAHGHAGALCCKVQTGGRSTATVAAVLCERLQAGNPRPAVHPTCGLPIR